MLPVIALVGRPNVGKSTLFNRLTASRDALVANQPGLTRDRRYGLGRLGERPYIVVDTGGLSGEREGLDQLMEQQVQAAIDEADLLLFLLDAREGMNSGDQQIAERLRRLGKPVFLVANKTDGLDPETAMLEFHGLGLGPPHAIAATHGRGVRQLMDEVLASLPEREASAAVGEDQDRVAVAVVGRPNVGKSTLINRILGEHRVVVYDRPGTTRDSVFLPFERDGQGYTLIDTAGVRRRARVKETVEKFSVIKTLDAIQQANVVILVLDAREGVADQDAHLLGLVLEAGRGLVIAVNKWDGLEPGQRETLKRQLDIKLPFLDFARIHYISALHGSGVGKLFPSIGEAHRSATRKFPTSRLTQILEDAVSAHQPPLVRGRRIKLRYAHQGGQNPPRIIIHGNQTDRLQDAYKRYLSGVFRKVLHLRGTPVILEFRTAENPYKGRVNRLTPRQEKKHKRLLSHVKRRR